MPSRWRTRQVSAAVTPRPQGRLGHEPGHPLAVVGLDQGQRVAVDQLAGS